MPETPSAIEFGRHASPGSWFLARESEIEERQELLPYSHYLRQAWTEVALAGILCVDGRPAVYLCESSHFTPEQKRQRHRFVWNQGLVPLLVFLTPDHVEVHSTVTMPQRDLPAEGFFSHEPPSLVRDLGTVAEALEIVRFVRSVETGQFFQDHAEFFPAGETVDRCLLKNLVHAARRLKGAGWDLPRAHALLGRTLFVCFLHERKFIKPDYYPAGTSCLLDILNQQRVEDAKRLLYREFFPRLKQEFNGTMFDTALADEEREIKKVHLDILADFLGRHDMESGQMTLGFWAYDFSFIPVEIISAIYEEFMRDADLGRKRHEGAYYTPRHLAETTLHVALDGRYAEAATWRVLDPACGSGIFLVAMFNLLAEQWQRENSTRRKQTKAQAMLDILQQQIRGVDVNPDACRIAAFSLYLALFEKLKPMDVEEFKERAHQGPFLPPLLWTERNPINNPVVLQGDFLKDELPLSRDFGLVIGNPPWESRGNEQIALHFALHSADFLHEGGVGCLLLPSAILVNRYGTLGGEWFRRVTVEKIAQLADLRRVLFSATHPCFIMRYVNVAPDCTHTIAYETPKLNRFDRRQGVIVVEPDDQKVLHQRDVIEAALKDNLQSLWTRKFWGTPRDESLLRRLDFYPALAELVGVRGQPKRWLAGTGFQPHYEHIQHKKYAPVPIPWRLSEAFLDARADLALVVFEDQACTLGERLKELGASTKKVLFARPEQNFQPPMVILNNGFTKFAFCARRTLFQDALRSITGPKKDEDLLRFLAVVLNSNLIRYVAFHSGSSNGIGREKMHLYESLNIPFPLPDHELAPANASDIVREAASLSKQYEAVGKKTPASQRKILFRDTRKNLESLVASYYQVTETERMLIEDTLTLGQPSIHRRVDSSIPALVFPDIDDRKRYADVLCNVLNGRARKRGVEIHAEGRVSRQLNLVFMTVFFGDQRKPYAETGGDEGLWSALERVSKAAQRRNSSFSYLRGFSYFESDRLHILKPATMRNWCRTAALNDADAIFEHLVGRTA